MRLRTLPLSLSGIIVGDALASKYGIVNNATVLFLVLTTCSLQILSNLSNELGDIKSGTDAASRCGIHYSVMDGQMTMGELMNLIFISTLCSCLAGAAMVYFSFGTFFCYSSLLFILLGAGAIIAAMRYTLGRHPYGYRGLGDLFVFIFFGLATTIGAFYICSHSFDFLYVILPASAIGCFSIGVLNVNNIRDMKTDMATRKTMAIRLGSHNARIYQTALIVMGWVLMLAFSLIFAESRKHWLYFITLPLFAMHLKGVWERKDKALDPMLPMLVMSTFAMSVIFWICF